MNLHLSVKTVESYRTHIKEKLGLGSAVELVRRAVEWCVETDRDIVTFSACSLGESPTARRENPRT